MKLFNALPKANWLCNSKVDELFIIAIELYAHIEKLINM